GRCQRRQARHRPAGRWREVVRGLVGRPAQGNFLEEQGTQVTGREDSAMSRPTDTAAWRALQSHYDKLKGVELRRLFAEDPRRGETFVAEGAGLYLDFSKNRITAETLGLLIQLARECGVSERRDAMFRGEKI